MNKYSQNEGESSASSSVKRKNSEDSYSEKKQQKLESSFKRVSQNELNKLIVGAICDAMLSFSFLENNYVRKLLEAGFPGKTILNRKSVIPLIEKDFQKLHDDMKNELQQQKYVCLTSDSWTSYRRYLSVR